jgi:hypothetical protein
MQRDYTKYNVQGLGEKLNKRRLVFTIVKDWIEKNNPSFEELMQTFPDEIQGSKGFIRKEAEVKDPKRFNMREPLKIKNGAHVVISNQWGENIESFINSASRLGYKIDGVKDVLISDVSQESDDWAVDNSLCEHLFISACEGSSGTDVGIKASFVPTSYFKSAVTYFNRLFNDDHAKNLFDFEEENGGVVHLSGSTYLLTTNSDVLGESWDSMIDEMDEGSVEEVFDGCNLNRRLQDFLMSAWREELYQIPVALLLEKFLIAPNQTVTVNLVDNMYGSSEVELSV